MLPDLISDLVDNNVINSNKPRITNNKFIRLSAKHTKYSMWCHQNNAGISALYHFSIWFFFFLFFHFISVVRWLALVFNFPNGMWRQHKWNATFKWLSNDWMEKRKKKYKNPKNGLTCENIYSRHIYQTCFWDAFPVRKYGIYRKI